MGGGYVRRRDRGPRRDWPRPRTSGRETYAVEQQRSWLAFERIFKIIGENALASDVSDQTYRAWLDRYPADRGIYTRYFQFSWTTSLSTRLKS